MQTEQQILKRIDLGLVSANDLAAPLHELAESSSVLLSGYASVLNQGTSTSLDRFYLLPPQSSSPLLALLAGTEQDSITSQITTTLLARWSETPGELDSLQLVAYPFTGERTPLSPQEWNDLQKGVQPGDNSFISSSHQEFRILAEELHEHVFSAVIVLRRDADSLDVVCKARITTPEQQHLLRRIFRKASARYPLFEGLIEYRDQKEPAPENRIWIDVFLPGLLNDHQQRAAGLKVLSSLISQLNQAAAEKLFI